MSREETTRECFDCGTRLATLHKPGCDIEQCPNCGRQFISCPCPPKLKRKRLPWTGEFPGTAECLEFEWYSRWVTGRGWVRCLRDDPGAGPDINRLHEEAQWDRLAGRFVKKTYRSIVAFFIDHLVA